MIEETISELEARIQGAEAIKPEHRAELLALLGTLKSEMAQIARTHSQEAQNIAELARLSAQEATRENTNPQLVQNSLEGLSTSVGQFEKSHPQLVQVVNRICETLANLGI